MGQTRFTGQPHGSTILPVKHWLIRHWGTMGLIGIVGLGAVLRLRSVGARDFWFDELLTLTWAGGRHWPVPASDTVVRSAPNPVMLQTAEPWWGIWIMLDGQGHPPLYMILLRLWCEVFGQSDFSLRMSSILPGLLCIALVYLLGRRLGGMRAALWAALLTAISAPMLWYAQELRPYSLMIALVLTAALLLDKVRQSGPALVRLIGIALVVLAMMLIHYFTAGVVVALLAWALIELRGKSRRRVAIAFGVAFYAFGATWGPFMWDQRRNTDHEFLVDTLPDPIAATLGRALCLPARYAAVSEPRTLSAALVVWSAIVLLVPLVQLRKLPALRLPLAVFIGAIALPLALDLIRGTCHLEWIRYTLIAAPAMYLMLPLVWTGGRKWLGHALPASALLLCLFCIDFPVVPGYPDYGIREMGRFVREHVTERDLLLFTPTDPGWDGSGIYAGLSLYSRHGRLNVLFATRDPGRLDEFPRVWVVTARSPIPPGWLAGRVVESRQTFRDGAKIQALVLPAPSSRPATSPATDGTQSASTGGYDVP